MRNVRRIRGTWEQENMRKRDIAHMIASEHEHSTGDEEKERGRAWSNETMRS